MAELKAVMGCALHWGASSRVGSHHIAIQLARRGWDVAFLSEPLSPPQLFAPKDKMSRLRNFASGGEVLDEAPNVWTYVPGAVVTPHNAPLFRTDWVHRNWWRTAIPGLVRRLRQAGFGRADLVYFDTPGYEFLLAQIPHARSVYRVTDNHAHMGYWTPARSAAESRLIQAVDLTVYSAGSLEDYVAEKSPRRKLLLGNGVDFAHFAEPAGERPPEYAAIGGRIAIYVGAMRRWFDHELVAAVAKSLPDLTLVLIGPGSSEVDALVRAYPNVRFLGTRDFSVIPRYLQHADIGLIPFAVAKYPELVHNISPLKMFEYMAAGLPAVATAWRELTLINGPFRLAHSPAEFIAAIEAELRSPTSPEVARAFAKERDWGAIVGRLLSTLGLSAA